MLDGGCSKFEIKRFIFHLLDAFRDFFHAYCEI